MKPQFRALRIKQLEKHLQPFFVARSMRRPSRGWIRALREVSGLTLRELATLTGKPHQAISQLEQSETEFSITLKSLNEIAEAMGGKLVYAIVPKEGDVRTFVKERFKRLVAPGVRAVEHSMALENQASGHVEEKIEEEAERLIERGKNRRWKS